MNLNIVDIIILLFILLGGVIGFKEGGLKKIISLVGLIVVLVVSFTLKNSLSVFFYENLPFFNLWGVFKGIQVINVIFYEMVAFLIIASLLMLVYRVILGLTGIIEKILKATIILSIPSKLIGLVVGLFEAYIWIYLFLFVLTLPVFNIKDIYNSKVSMFIITETPVLSKYTSKTIEIYNDLYDIIDIEGNKTNEELNTEAMKLMLDYEIITPESAKKLIDKNKVEVKDDSFLKEYE